MTGRVLVLNASYEPVNVCTERRAVVMIFKGIARMEEHNGHMLHSARITMHAPSVIRLILFLVVILGAIYWLLRMSQAGR